MCLALRRDTSTGNGVLSRGWRWISQRPFRLLLALSLLQTPALPALVDSREPLLVVLLFSSAGLPLLGYLLERFPGWFAISPVHHTAYFVSFLLGVAAMAAFALALPVTAVALLVTAWGVPLWSLGSRLRWVADRRQPTARALVAALTLFVLTLALTLPGLLVAQAAWLQAPLAVGGVLLILLLAGAGLLQRRFGTAACSAA